MPLQKTAGSLTGCTPIAYALYAQPIDFTIVAAERAEEEEEDEKNGLMLVRAKGTYIFGKYEAASLYILHSVD